ncbi:MAG TPA: Gfo/Idh/MocA family oxidoreductase, partial [Candidatus Dormibacteraeota bacterium]|nr:Gfo/Idh/MocA family oxidoreductase [Candidatus Dormibacteraeota bacterium]
MGRGAGGESGRGAAYGRRDGDRRAIHRAGRGPDRGRHIAGDIGWGILGAAWIAGRAVIPAIAASRNGRLVSIASRDADRARALASRDSFARIAQSYDAVLEDTEVDAVYIPLVNSLHREWTLRAFAAGKHVLCEKPLAMNAAEAEEMAVAAQRSRMHLMEAFMYRFHPRTRGFIESLRDPLYVQARFGFKLDDPANYRMHESLGGGALLDVGCYTVNAARWILGEPSTVHARSRFKGGVDMTTSALLEFPEGQTAAVWASFESAEGQ